MLSSSAMMAYVVLASFAGVHAELASTLICGRPAGAVSQAPYAVCGTVTVNTRFLRIGSSNVNPRFHHT